MKEICLIKKSVLLISQTNLNRFLFGFVGLIKSLEETFVGCVYMLISK